MTDPGNRTVTFGYDSDGNRTTITRPNGVSTTTAYDAAGQISSIDHTKAGSTLKNFIYTMTTPATERASRHPTAPRPTPTTR